MSEQATKFVQHHPNSGATISPGPQPGARTLVPHQSRSPGSAGVAHHGQIHRQQPATATVSDHHHQQQQQSHQHHSSKQRSRSLVASASRQSNSSKRPNKSNNTNNLQVRRTLRVKVRKSKPILGIAIEGGFNVSGQLIPRIVCVHVSSKETAGADEHRLLLSSLIARVLVLAVPFSFWSFRCCQEALACLGAPS